jgi:hypothetical protein
VPVAVFLLALWVLQWVPQHVGGGHQALAPTFAGIVLAATFTPQPVLVTGLLMAALVVAGILLTRPRGSPAHPSDKRAADVPGRWPGPRSRRG